MFARSFVCYSHAVGRGDRADVVGRGDGTGNGRLLVGVVKALAAEEGGSTLRELEDDGGLVVAGTLEGGVDGGRRSDVLSRGQPKFQIDSRSVTFRACRSAWNSQ